MGLRLKPDLIFKRRWAVPGTSKDIMKTHHIIVADDHPMVVNGLIHILRDKAGLEISATASSTDELFAALESKPCDILVCDFSMPSGELSDGVLMFSRIRRQFPGLGIVILTMVDQLSAIRALLDLGIHCIVSKRDAEEHLSRALLCAMQARKFFSPAMAEIVDKIELERRTAGKQELTTREAEGVRMFAAGMTVTEIAAKLKRSKKTISTQKMSAMRKMGVQRDSDLVMQFLGLMDARESST